LKALPAETSDGFILRVHEEEAPKLPFLSEKITLSPTPMSSVNGNNT
jgi:hypothetical protein